MNVDERIVETYLKSLHIGTVLYEPDGNVPPDFLIDNRIAVEARRLNQHIEIEGRPKGLEEDSIPLLQSLTKLLAAFGAPREDRSWFVLFSFRRPLAPIITLRPKIRDALERFLHSPSDEQQIIVLDDRFKITIAPASPGHEWMFLLGGYIDRDAGGWVVAETIRNLSAYLEEKTRKVAPYRAKYRTWWIVFVDYTNHARDETAVRQHITRPDAWDRMVVLSPIDGRAYEI